MSSTNKTAHYQLNQWIGTDPVLMADFNADNAKIDAALAAGLRLASGTYTGSGSYGSSNKNSLHFDFVPKLLLIFKSEISASSSRFSGTAFGLGDYCAILPYTALTDLAVGAASGSSNASLVFKVYNGEGGVGNCNFSVSDQGKTLSWYGTAAASQLNESGKTYYWAAIG